MKMIDLELIALIREDCYAAALRDAIEAITVYANETHKHYGDLFGHCRQEYGDRCDITAALRVVAGRIEALGQITDSTSDLSARQAADELARMAQEDGLL